MKRSAGFTLLEILIVVAIIGVILAMAVASVASSRAAARARVAARGVSQMSHYASALAILRQRTAVISFSGNTISVQLSGEGVDTSEVGQPALPIYQEEVNGEDVGPRMIEQEVAEGRSERGNARDGRESKQSSYLYTERVLDLEELAKEDATRTFEGVVFRVELVDEEGRALDAQTATQLRSEADALVAKRKTAGAAWSNTSGEIDLGASGDAKNPGVRPEDQGRVIYETNGNCAPYRVKVFSATEDGEEGEELMTVHVSRSGKVTIGDEEDGDR